MKRRATRRACVLAALLVSIGCFHDEVPSGTRVACHGDDDCPPGFLCRPGVEMCVVRGQMDDAPPSLSGPVSITPALAKAGDTLLVELKASEPLLIDPRVRVGTEEVPLDEPGTDRARLTYRFARRVIGVEPEDSPLPVTVDLLDAAGNAANGLAAGSARFDFTLPKVLSSSEVEPLAARRGVSARVSFSVSEAVGQAPVVTMAPPSGAGSERAWVKTEPDASGSFAYRYTVQGDEEEGLWFVSVTAVDLAGNLSRPTVVGQVALDFTAPGVPDLQRVEVSPPAAAVGRTVMVEVAASETVQSSARLYAGSIAFAAPQAREHVLTFLHTVEGDEDGVWALRLEGLEDLAGNVADPIAVGEVTLDGTPPAILDLAIAPTRASAVAGHEVVVASFALSESPASLDVRLGNRPMSCVVSPASLGAQATCRYQVSGNEVEGGQIVSVLALDAAGNAGIASARVELDFTAPSPLPDADVRLIAPSGCPLQDVIRLGAGATLRVLFSTDEAAIDPLVRTRSPEELDFTRAWGTTTFFEFRHTLSTAAHAQGRYEVEVVLEDAVGNRSASALGLREPGFVVDTESPAAPQVNQAGLLVFHREPWDTADSQGQVRMRLLAAAGAAEAEATLIAYGGSPEAELGRAQTEADGSAELILVAGDRPRIRVASVDAACNASGKVLVREGEWVASMGGKVAGSTVENPNRLVSRAWMGPVSAPVGPAVGAPALGGTTMAALDGQAALQAGEPAYFVHRFSTCPPATLRSTLAFDDARGRLVLFGGLDSGNTAYGVVFEHGVTEWRPAATADPEGDGDPSPRYGQAVAYDDARGQLVMFGGYEGATFSDQTWGWDGTSWRRMGASLHPAGAYAAAMAYDRTRRKVVLLGGAVGLSDDSGETWEWDGASWQRVEPLDPEGDGNPAARSEHAMAWDGGRGRVLLLGGHQILGSIDPTSLGDQWEWDGASWKRVIPLDPEGDGNPSARRNHAMAWDGVREKVVLFGGGESEMLGDTWEWDGASWRRVTPADPEGDGNPDSRGSHAMAYDALRGRVVLFGGFHGNSLLGDVWEWDGASWRERRCGQDPDGWGARYGQELAFDEARGRVLMFGGVLSNWAVLDELRAWDGSGWTVLTPTDPEHDGSPPPRQRFGMAFDSVRARLVLFGGTTDFANTGLGDTWEWDGASWRRLVVAGPSSRLGHKMVFDPARRRTVLFGGRPSGTAAPSGETWEWNGTSWTQIAPSDPEGDGNPSARSDMALVYDRLRQRTVLFGGVCGVGASTALSAETWEWNGASWRLVQPSDPEGDGHPPASSFHAVAFDEVRGRLVLHGGVAEGNSLLEQLWEWDGTSWARRAPADPEGAGSPTARYAHAAVFDAARGRTLLSGGLPRFDARLWELDYGPSMRPGLVMSAAIGAAGLPQGTELLSVTPWFVAGGHGESQGAGLEGAALWAWFGGGWRELALGHNDAPVDAVADLRSEVLLPVDLQALPFQGDLHFAVVPRGANGSRLATVAADYGEVRVRYRLPEAAAQARRNGAP